VYEVTISVAQAQLFLLALTRVLAIIIHVPVLAGPQVPNQVKIGLGALLAVVILPWQPLPAGTASMTLLAWGVGIARELLIGTLAGYSAVLTFNALQIAGSLMSISAGFEAGRIINPSLESAGSSMQQFFLLTTMLIFFAINGHHLFLIGLQRTFTILPINQPLPNLTADYLVRLTAQMITVGVQLSLPVMGSLLLADITLGLLARVAPQVQVFFLGVPVKVGIGILALILSIGVILPTLSKMFQDLSINMIKLVGG
jgi:flagellar biosynthesis protein FliR